MEHDVPPSDEEILATLAESDGGLTPVALVEELSKSHTTENVIKAIQRAFGRGIVRLSSGARLVAVEDEVAEAA